jgi:hypothetical protein
MNACEQQALIQASLASIGRDARRKHPRQRCEVRLANGSSLGSREESIGSYPDGRLKCIGQLVADIVRGHRNVVAEHSYEHTDVLELASIGLLAPTEN